MHGRPSNCLYSVEMKIRALLIDTTGHTSPLGALEGLSPSDAMRRLAGAPHSIAEILAHMVYWQEWFQKRYMGLAEPIVEKAALGWPGVQAEDWGRLQSRFAEGLESLVKLSEWCDLEEKVTPAIEVPIFEDTTRGEVFVHVATHNAHHLGQIITLRQMMGVWPPPAGGLTW